MVNKKSVMYKIYSTSEFREWLENNHNKEKECWACVKRGKPTDNVQFWYLDAIEVALCYGWIDSVCKKIEGETLQRFSPRRKGGNWTELNKERVRRLEKLGLMTDAGRVVLPPMDDKSFLLPQIVENALKNAGVWNIFTKFPPLYQRVKASNVAFYQKRNPDAFEKALKRLIDETMQGKMYGEWNDYGRLI